MSTSGRYDAAHLVIAHPGVPKRSGWTGERENRNWKEKIVQRVWSVENGTLTSRMVLVRATYVLTALGHRSRTTPSPLPPVLSTFPSPNDFFSSILPPENAIYFNVVDLLVALI